jgi:hypothetical protein
MCLGGMHVPGHPCKPFFHTHARQARLLAAVRAIGDGALQPAERARNVLGALGF